MDCSLPSSSVYGISKTSIPEWLPFPTPGDLPDSGIEPAPPESPASADWFFTITPPGKPPEQGWKLLSCVWLFGTLWTGACQALLSIVSSRQEYWSGLPFTSPGDLPDSGLKPWSPALQAGSSPSEPPEKLPTWQTLPDLPSSFGISKSTLLCLSFCSRSPMLTPPLLPTL